MNYMRINHRRLHTIITTYVAQLEPRNVAQKWPRMSVTNQLEGRHTKYNACSRSITR